MKEIIEKLKSETKFLHAFRIVFYIVGLILIFVGGLELMIMVYIALFAFIIGRFYEKTMAAIKDYRLLQKVNKVTYDKVEYESMQKELENYKKILQNQRVVNPNPAPRPHYYPNYDESEVY